MSEKLDKLKEKDQRALDAFLWHKEKLKFAQARVQALKQRVGELGVRWLKVHGEMLLENEAQRRANDLLQARELAIACRMIGRMPPEPIDYTPLGAPEDFNKD